jgi:hypothetical protein
MVFCSNPKLRECNMSNDPSLHHIDTQFIIYKKKKKNCPTHQVQPI